MVIPVNISTFWTHFCDRLRQRFFFRWQWFETVFQSISGRLPETGRKRREKIAESKNVKTTLIMLIEIHSRWLYMCFALNVT